MDSILPFSVLKSKRVKQVRIINDQEIENDSKNRQADYEKNILDVVNSSLYIQPEHINFVRSYISYFYRNNLSMIFLAMNIIHDYNFVNSQYYRPFINYIQRRQTSESDKQENFEIKFDVQLKAYIKKIQNLMLKLNLTYI